MIDRKEIHIVFADENIREAFLKLKSGKFESIRLYNLLLRAFDDLKKNPFIGIEISKRLMPKTYVQNYNISNLWKYNLPNAWRLLYTIKADEIAIICIVLEWMDHKAYERRFNY